MHRLGFLGPFDNPTPAMNHIGPIASAKPTPSQVSRWDRRMALTACAYIVLYVLLDGLSYVQPVVELGITPWNPQAGLTLALLLYHGPRWLPVTAVAALLSEVFVRELPAFSPLAISASLWIAIAYSAFAAMLRRRELAAPIRTSAAAAWLAGGCLVVTPLIASGYVGLFVGAGVLPSGNAMGNIVRYWVGDTNGILTLTPLLLYAREWREALRVVREHRWEVLAQCVTLVAVLWISFGPAAADQLRFFYPLFVPVIWIALRWGLPGAMLACLASQLGVIIGAQESRAPPLIDLQLLILTLGMTALLLGAVVTERVRVLRRIAAREAEQRALLAMSPDAVLAVDSAGQVCVSNPAAVRLFGERAGAQSQARLEDLLPDLALASLQGRATLDARRGDGTGFPAEIAWARLDTPANEGFLVTVRDATERLRAEARLRERDTALARAMRFAVAGELASALAHELNQPITALVTYLRALERLAEPLAAADERVKTTLGKAAHEAIRASEVLRRLRDFYRGGAFKREAVHIPSLCSGVVAAFQDRSRRSDVQLLQQIDPDIPTIEADSIQLEIVLHNLLINAMDAVVRQPTGSRRIEVTALNADGQVLLQVEDSGEGICPDVSEQLFEPFVTSKPDGMGLGLVISRSLVRGRGGDLSLVTPGKLGGACFRVRLPVEVPGQALLV
jgi:signal transduction histidine kinase